MKKFQILILIVLLSGLTISTGWAETVSLVEPSNLEATVVSSFGIELTWEDNSYNETGFRIERRTTGSSYRQIATVGENTTAYTNTDLASGIKYYYRVRAYNTDGNSAYSNEVSATTAIIPDAPSDLTATVTSESRIELSWEDNSYNETGFKIERKKSGGSYTRIATVDKNVTNIINTGLAGNTKYYYRVSAYNAAGDSAYSNEVSLTTGIVPDEPSDLTATVISESRIELTWEDNSSNETGFKIERKKSGGSYTRIATVDKNVTNIINTGLAGNTKYYYRIRAYNEAGDSAYSNEVSATTGIVPEAPSDLTAKVDSATRVNLTWEDNSSNETGFKIERKKSGGSYTRIATVDEDTTSFTDTGLTADTRYYYRVRAYNSTGDSSYSSETSVTTSQPGTIISLIIGKTSYYVNNQRQTMDTAPIIYADRTLLPIRYIAEAIGANVGWSNSERKVTMTLKGTVIELWIGNNYARVGGQYKLIDSSNPQVTPIIVEPGRTMLPLRFIAENLGSRVDWDAGQKEVTVTYPAP